MDQAINFVKYPKIPYLENLAIFPADVSIFEKIDGSNCQIRAINGRLALGNRSNFVMGRRWDHLGGYKEWITDFKKWAMSNSSLYNLPSEMVMFGEWVSSRTETAKEDEQRSSVEYPIQYQNKFFFLDMAITNHQGDIERVLPYDYARNVLKQLEINDLIYLPEIKLPRADKKEVERLLVEGLPEKYALKDMEGIVIKDYKSPISEAQILARKWLSKPYSEISQERNLQTIDRYSTTPRIRKTYYKLLEQGFEEEDIDEELLFHAVREDILKEAKINPGEGYLSERIRKFMKAKI